MSELERYFLNFSDGQNYVSTTPLKYLRILFLSLWITAKVSYRACFIHSKYPPHCSSDYHNKKHVTRLPLRCPNSSVLKSENILQLWTLQHYSLSSTKPFAQVLFLVTLRADRFLHAFGLYSFATVWLNPTHSSRFTLSPAHCGSVIEHQIMNQEVKVWFGSRNMARLQARYAVGGVQKAVNQWFSVIIEVSIKLPFSL